jgi:hypothetical protein
MTPSAPDPNSLSKEFVKILPQGFCPHPKVKTTLTENPNPLKTLCYQNLSTVDAP